MLDIQHSRAALPSRRDSAAAAGEQRDAARHIALRVAQRRFLRFAVVTAQDVQPRIISVALRAGAETGKEIGMAFLFQCGHNDAQQMAASAAEHLGALIGHIAQAAACFLH